MKTFLLVGALVSFAFATFGAPIPVVQLLPLGLALWVASLLVN